MSEIRHTDKNQPEPQKTERTPRGYEINGKWYFELRGGGQKGPFDTEAEMRTELNDFIQSHQIMNQRR